jgi:hypothetical protein
MSEEIPLVSISGPTCIHISVQIDEHGDLLFSGQDVGEAPRKVFGDADYEYWLRIKAEHKDQVLLALLARWYAGNARLITEIGDLLASRGIPSEFYAI